ncbi:MAG: hypothetical protein JKY71_09945 [Alphaproteobacteria bacterium]|nr:hypothetical protein [Alphaproteobacteria bacterium]
MVSIPGASGFLNAATLANKRGIAASPTSLLNGGIGAPDLLDVGRRINRNSIGLSGNARAVNKRFLESSTSTFNAIFSLGVGNTSSIEALQKGILALRSKAPSNGLARSIQEELGISGSETLDSAVEAEKAAKEASDSLSRSSSSVLGNSGSAFSVNA